VPVPEVSMSWGREPSRRTTRATPKVKEAEPTRSKLKEKGRAKVDDCHESAVPLSSFPLFHKPVMTLTLMDADFTD
jgi:hypothetical protein